MNHRQRRVLKTIFTSEKNPCNNKLFFEGCEELYEAFNKASNAPGCSACAKRRARNKFGEMLIKKVHKLDYDTVYPGNPQNKKKQDQ